MKKIVLAAVAMGALAVGGGAVAVAQSGETAAKGAVTIEVIGGPEGTRTFSTVMNKDVKITTSEGGKYTLNFLLDGEKADSKEFGHSDTGWDCGGSDQYGINYGCVVAP